MPGFFATFFDAADPFRPKVREKNHRVTRCMDLLCLLISVALMAVYGYIAYTTAKTNHDNTPPTQTTTLVNHLDTPVYFMVWTCCQLSQFNTIPFSQHPNGTRYNVLTNIGRVQCSDGYDKSGFQYWHSETFLKLEALPNPALAFNGLNTAIIRVVSGDDDTGTADCSACFSYDFIRVYSIDAPGINDPNFDFNNLTCFDTYYDAPEHHGFSQTMLTKNYMSSVQLGVMTDYKLNGSVLTSLNDGAGGHLRTTWDYYNVSRTFGWEMSAPKTVTVVKENKAPFPSQFGSISGGCNSVFLAVTLVYSVLRPFIVRCVADKTTASDPLAEPTQLDLKASLLED